MITTIAGNQVHQLVHHGRNSLVYRGQRQADSRPVILKMINLAYPSPEKIAWFRREYELTRGLQLPGVVETYALEFDQGHWVMVLEDFGAESLDRSPAREPLLLDQFLCLALQLADILGQVHQQRVIHKDINPSNIVLNRKTGELKLIDFGIASVLSRENPTLRHPSLIEGTLAYISPEQTGRMNRAIDYRTDFYSLGVTFFELLTGQLPFPATEAMALIHAHIAQPPPEMALFRPDLPPIVAALIARLMAKNAEDRYQSAYGLKADLEECRRQWTAIGRVESFPLGRDDLPDLFQLPQQLYGRERETGILLASFDRARRGTGAMLLVSGYTGIGKTTLVREIYKPLTHRRGYFIAGKFDQFRRDIPYQGLVQAFSSLIRQLLTETGVAAWREKVLAALGPNGRVMVEIIPELELLIGPQPAAPALPPAEAQHRFNLAFQSFVQVFAQPEHPLVFFLDDLQWADGASLKLLHLLLTLPHHPCLLLIGAYRDNEVQPAHPLLLAVDEIRQAGLAVNEITLRPLELPDASRFVADTLHQKSEAVQPLAELVQARTQGNPFFMGEFLKSLYSAGLIYFVPPNGASGGWRWDLPAIQARGITGNVVDLLVGKIQELEPDTQALLQAAACIGSEFDLQTLAVVSRKTPAQAAAKLWPALVEGLLLPLDEAYPVMNLEVQGLAEAVSVSYRFAHDRIRQAVYSLLPETGRQVIHRQIGQLLWQSTTSDERDGRIFDITNHLNLARSLITQPGEAVELAGLNLTAGRKAKAAAAYPPAFFYLQIGLELLETIPAAWEQQYQLALELHVEAAEAAYLSGNYDRMEGILAVVWQRARTLLDQVKAYEVSLQADVARYRLSEAVRTGLQVLKLLGLELPEKPDQAAVKQGLEEAQAVLAGKSIEELAGWPEMTDPEKLAAFHILVIVTYASSVGQPELHSLCMFNLIKLSVEHGHTAESAPVYATYGLTLQAVAGDIEAGYQFNRLALRLLDRFEVRAMVPKTLYVFNTFTRHWKEHLRETLYPLLEVYQTGLETGDLVYGALAPFIYALNSFWAGRELAGLEQEMGKYGEAMGQLKQELGLNWNRLYRQAVLNLLDQADAPTLLQGQSYDEGEALPRHQAANDRVAIANLHLLKLSLGYLFREYEQAAAAADGVEAYLDGLLTMAALPAFTFYASLARLALYPQAGEAEQQRILEKVAAGQEKMKTWVTHAPMNFEHKFYLVEAERARILGQVREARELYDRAINLAEQHKYLNDEALAHELAGRFYLAHHQPRVAYHYLRDAHYAYLRWGAQAKVKDLEQAYPQVLAQRPAGTQPAGLAGTTETGQRASSILDLASVLKASQAISGEIVLDRLLTTLMKIMIENAGAQTGYLLLQKDGYASDQDTTGWVIEATGGVTESGAEGQALVSQPVKADRLPVAIIQYVTRTKEHVALDDAGREALFATDPYIAARQPRSILCTPLINQGQLIGLLYLENNLSTGAFTPDRLEVLNILSAQAAISIQNARHYTRQVQLTNAASRFVPQEFLQFLKKENIVKVQLGDQAQQEMTILVSDIRSFTTLSEAMTPQENFDFVNAYLGRVSPIIREHNGFIAKYMGDGVMAVFPGRPEDAINAAIKTQQTVAFSLNVERERQGQPPLRIGIGIHAGPVMLGTVGEAQRMQLDLLSDAVNVTARLEGLTKLYGVTLMISTEVFRRLTEPSQYQVRFLGKALVKGRRNMLPIFEIFDGEPAEIVALKQETRTDFEQGLHFYYNWQLAEARASFKRVLQDYPEDRASQFYLERMAELTEYRVTVEDSTPNVG